MTGEKYMEHARDSIDLNWEQQEPLFRQINEVGVQSYFENLPQIEQAFQLRDRGLRCIDERTPGGLHMAGSGILDQERAVKLVPEAQIDGIYSHEGCGAAAFFAKQAGLDVLQADNYGIEWAKKLAAETGVPYVDHRKVDKPFHYARVAYYDGTGRFNTDSVEGLPPGFVISRRFLDAQSALNELGIVRSIALGDHGFGLKFTPESPLLVVAVGDKNPSGNTSEKLLVEISELLKQSGKRVAGYGFTAPV